MKPLTFMLIAGDPSGDLLAAELVTALREKVLARSEHVSADVQPLQTALAPRFFGAGGAKMAAAGVEIAADLTQHSVIGFAEVVKKVGIFRQIFKDLLKLAIDRQPDVIVGVDSGGFNLRFARAVRRYVRRHQSEFVPWNPRIVQFISPQVWASRPGRAYTLQDNHDLLLSIFPFEKAWYAQRVPKLRVEFVGHPMIGRTDASNVGSEARCVPAALLLPGSRTGEVRRHVPVLAAAFVLMQRQMPELVGKIILPSESLRQLAAATPLPSGLELQVGGLAAALSQVDVALTKSGTVTMECALRGVPAVVFYKISWPTYFIAKQVATVKYLAMPNLIADEPIYPEFVQQTATPENISRVALELLRDEKRRASVLEKLTRVVAALGKPGAPGRAATAILNLLP